METSVSNIVNCGFGWFIVLLAVAGYILTLRSRGEKWLFWIILAIGWAFFATAQTLLIAGIDAGTGYLVGIWLSSYFLVILSMALLFLRLTRVRN